ERLHQVVVGAGVQAFDPVVHGAPRRQEDRRSPDPRGAETDEQVEPVSAREHPIEDEQVIGRAPGVLQALPPLAPPAARKPPPPASPPSPRRPPPPAPASPTPPAPGPPRQWGPPATRPPTTLAREILGRFDRVRSARSSPRRPLVHPHVIHLHPLREDRVVD